MSKELIPLFLEFPLTPSESQTSVTDRSQGEPRIQGEHTGFPLTDVVPAGKSSRFKTFGHQEHG